MIRSWKSRLARVISANKIMKRAVTLVELLVSVVILALIIAGLANIFVTSRRYVAWNRSRLQATEFNKQILENFTVQVRQDTWNDASNPLYVGTGKTNGTVTLNNILYNSSYNVSDMNNATFQNAEMRKVRMVINWTEPVP